MKRTQKEIDSVYMKMAESISEFSRAIRRKVGCVIVKDRQIISDGYNGTPAGFNNVCEYPATSTEEEFEQNCPDEDMQFEMLATLNFSMGSDALKTKPMVLHAEANAITKLAKTAHSAEGATIYVTDEPCYDCSKLIIQAGIRRVVFKREYTRHQGIELLKKAGIEVLQIDK